MNKIKTAVVAIVMVAFASNSKGQAGIGLNADYISFSSAKVSSISMGLSVSNYFGDDGNIYYGVNLSYMIPKTTERTYTLQPYSAGFTAKDVSYELNTRMVLIGVTLGKILNGDYEDGGLSASIGYFYGFGSMRIPSHDSVDVNNYMDPFPSQFSSSSPQKERIGYMCIQAKVAYLLRIGETFALMPFVAFGFGRDVFSDSEDGVYPRLKSNFRVGLAIEYMPY